MGSWPTRLLPVLLLPVAVQVAAQQGQPQVETTPQWPTEWVFPIHRTASPVNRTKTVTEHYDYLESEYSPAPILRDFVAREDASYETPEQAFVSRVSAMVAGDYDWWLAHWDEDSQRSIAARNSGNVAICPRRPQRRFARVQI